MVYNLNTCTSGTTRTTRTGTGTIDLAESRSRRWVSRTTSRTIPSDRVSRRGVRRGSGELRTVEHGRVWPKSPTTGMSFERLRKLPLIPPHRHGKLSRKPEGGVEFEAADRVGHERLLRYCARPPFALERLRELDPDDLLYESTKQGPGGTGPQIHSPIRCSRPPSSSTSASPGTRDRRHLPARDAGRARACPRQPARPRPRWRQRLPESATTSVRSSPLPAKMDA